MDHGAGPSQPTGLTVRFKRTPSERDEASSSLPPGLTVRIKRVALDNALDLHDENQTATSTNHPAAAPTSEEEPRGVNAPSEEETRRTTKRVDEDQAAEPSTLRPEEKRRIKELARNVVQDPDGHVTERLLRRLHGMTRDKNRWGFMLPDHPVHAFYLKQKDIERERLRREERSAMAERRQSPSRSPSPTPT